MHWTEWLILGAAIWMMTALVVVLTSNPYKPNSRAATLVWLLEKAWRWLFVAEHR